MPAVCRIRCASYCYSLRPAALSSSSVLASWIATTMTRWSSRAFPASPFPHTMHPGDMSVEARIPEATQQALISRGHKLRIAPPWSLGSNAGIVVDVNTGVLSAVNDSARPISSTFFAGPGPNACCRPVMTR